MSSTPPKDTKAGFGLPGVPRSKMVVVQQSHEQQTMAKEDGEGEDQQKRHPFPVPWDDLPAIARPAVHPEWFRTPTASASSISSGSSSVGSSSFGGSSISSSSSSTGELDWRCCFYPHCSTGPQRPCNHRASDAACHLGGSRRVPNRTQHQHAQAHNKTGGKGIQGYDPDRIKLELRILRAQWRAERQKKEEEEEKARKQNGGEGAGQAEAAAAAASSSSPHTADATTMTEDLGALPQNPDAGTNATTIENSGSNNEASTTEQ